MSTSERVLATSARTSGSPGGPAADGRKHSLRLITLGLLAAALALPLAIWPDLLEQPWLVWLLGLALGACLLAGWQELRPRLERSTGRRANASIPDPETLKTLIVSAVEQSPVSLVITDREGIVVYVNAKFTHFSGYRREEVVGQHVKILRNSEQNPDIYRQLWQSIAEGREWRGDVLNRRKDGTAFWENMAIAPVRGADGNIHYFFAVREDISARKQIEEERQHLQEELARMDRVNLLGELAATLAHEVRQPLATIVNYAGGCLHRIEDGADPKTLVFALDKIAEQGKLAGSIVARIRALVAGNTLGPVPVDINQLARNVSELLRSDAERRGVTLELDLSPEVPLVTADPIRIQQVLLNLMLNAIQAMAGLPARRRWLCVHTAPESGEGVSVTVEDAGPGASEEELKQFFRPFYTTKATGMGMGLAICRRIVEAHGGHIQVTGNERQGLSFRFTLPANGYQHAA